MKNDITHQIESIAQRILQASTKMTDVQHSDARGATLVMTVSYQVDRQHPVLIVGKRDQLDPGFDMREDMGNLLESYRKILQDAARGRAKSWKPLASDIRRVLPRYMGHAQPGVEYTARLGHWSYQASWSDNSGVVIRCDDKGMGDAIFGLVKKAFPITGGGVPGSTGFRGHGELRSGPPEWVWENASFGIGD